MSKQAEEYFNKYIKANDCRGELYKGKIVLKKEQWFQFAQDYYESRVNAVTDEVDKTVLRKSYHNSVGGRMEFLDKYLFELKNKLLNK